MLATLDDVSTRLGRSITDPAEVAQVSKWIEDVVGRITSRIPSILDDILTGFPSANTVSSIIAEVVIRKIKNPDGFRSERIDDYYYDRGSLSSDLSLADAEWAQLTPMSASGAFSVRPSFEPDRPVFEVW